MKNSKLEYDIWTFYTNTTWVRSGAGPKRKTTVMVRTGPEGILGAGRACLWDREDDCTSSPGCGWCPTSRTCHPYDVKERKFCNPNIECQAVQPDPFPVSVPGIILSGRVSAAPRTCCTCPSIPGPPSTCVLTQWSSVHPCVLAHVWALRTRRDQKPSTTPRPLFAGSRTRERVFCTTEQPLRARSSRLAPRRAHSGSTRATGLCR